jgi:hypothetical protein
MADVKISGLPASTTPLAGTEILPIVQGSVTKQVSIANVTAGRAIAATSITTDTYKAASSSGGALQNSGGTPQLQWGAGGGNNLSVDVAININPANAAVAISPTGTGTVAISPAGALTVNPTAASTMNNVAIGGSTAAAGKFTTLEATGVSTFSAGTAAAPAITTTGNTNTGIFFPAADTIAFTEGGAESMRITNASNLLIGTTTATGARLDIYNAGAGDATIRVGNSQNALTVSIGKQGGTAYGATAIGDGFFYATSSLSLMSDNATGIIKFSTGGNAERMRIASDGVVTMSAYGAGAATFSAAGVISSVSDETWKTKDGVPVNPDAMLQKLEPGYWFYNEEKSPIFGTDRQLGFYAQNVNEAIGNEAAPTPEEGKPWGYYDRSVLAVAVMSLKNALNSIQEQQAIIENLTTRLNALEEK